MQADQIADLIAKGISGADVRVRGDDGVHFEAVVVSQTFDGLSMIRRHRLVYDVLGELVGGEIHALSLQAFTPAEWSARVQASQ
ncbi:MAG: BolA/IbaG family iron-sulfur metabolism protein [Pseudomonadota bacterium]|nr:BolA/IbaG family iron-sulfur metabolism protein [Pseudomonadota bacterium]